MYFICLFVLRSVVLSMIELLPCMSESEILWVTRIQTELGLFNLLIATLFWCCVIWLCLKWIHGIVTWISDMIVQAIRRYRTPGPVRNLRVTRSDPKEPSVTLAWDPPLGSCGITSYEVHFQSCSAAGGHAYMTGVDSHTTSVCISKEMGLEPLRLYIFKVRAKGQDRPGEWSKVSMFISAAVRNLRVRSDPKEPSVTLAWDPPLGSCDIISSYEVHFQNCSGGHVYMTGVDRYTTSVCISKEMGLEPLRRCVFKVRAKDLDEVPGEWSEVSKFVDWHCRFPGCENNRCRLDYDHDCTYGFCGRQHYITFTKSYCLYDDCCKPKADGGSDFCSSEHLEMAVDKGFAAVVQVDTESRLYETLSHKFKADWNPAKGPCPLILTILRIINPYLEQRLKKYAEGVPWWYRGHIEQYYHGTKLECKITDYYRLCGGSSCGICGIAANGFSRSRIRTRSWQRFGSGFYFAPNSSKSHDYPIKRSVFGCIHQDTFQALLLCDVAPGRKYELRENATGLTGPPEGYHSVYGRSKSWWRNSVLNYDEIVLFDPNAISPVYIIVYSN